MQPHHCLLTRVLTIIWPNIVMFSVAYYRFFLTQSEVDKYAASVRNEIVTTSEHQELELEMEKGDLEMEMEMEEGSLDMAKDEESEYWDAHQHWLLQDRSIIGSQFYWHCSAEELSKVLYTTHFILFESVSLPALFH